MQQAAAHILISTASEETITRERKKTVIFKILTLGSRFSTKKKGSHCGTTLGFWGGGGGWENQFYSGSRKIILKKRGEGQTIRARPSVSGLRNEKRSSAKAEQISKSNRKKSELNMQEKWGMQEGRPFPGFGSHNRQVDTKALHSSVDLLKIGRGPRNTRTPEQESKKVCFTRNFARRCWLLEVGSSMEEKIARFHF